ncbi:MAG TPA: phospholipase D-like domain-containing protein [Anaerolineales bacterium]|nr:phospholipase D-like domain-containing protein [Anaerolineales bacterium]
MTRRRTISKAQGGVIALLIAVLLLVCSAFYALLGIDRSGHSNTVTPTLTPSLAAQTATNTPFLPNPTITDTAVSSQPTTSFTWWEVYFTDPINLNNPDNLTGTVEEKLIGYINAAQTSIHIASFEFDLTRVAEALIAAKQRGVDVRWVTDDEHGLEADTEPGHGQFAMLMNAGIEVRDDLGRSAFMHNKFWIFDRQIVWTGSTNITKSAIYTQNNNVLVIHSPELAAIYEREFDEMWNGQFGARSPSTLSEQSVIVNGTPIQVIFTSEDPALETVIVPLVQNAQSSVRFMAFSFTDFPLADAMIQRSLREVDVAGVFESFGSESEAAELRTLFCAGVPVRQDGNSGFLHHKVIIVDARFVVTGSLNFSTRAETTNDENVIVVDNPDIARLYLQEFERVWAIAKVPDPAKFTCQ